MRPADEATLDDLARRLDAAALTLTPIGQAGDHDRLSLDAAYAVQRRLFALRLARGERAVGVKLGFTQRAAQARFGLDGPLLGRLSDRMRLAAGEPLVLSRYLKPRVEAEIAFVLARPLTGEIDLDTAIAAIGSVMPALEIIDTRYRDFRLSLPDLVADDTSAAGFVLGPPSAPATEVGSRPMRVTVNGEVRQQASSAAIMGHPAESIRAAARQLGATGETLPAGSIILAGCAAEPLTVQPGDHVRLQVDGLGEIALDVQA